MLVFGNHEGHGGSEESVVFIFQPYVQTAFKDVNAEGYLNLLVGGDAGIFDGAHARIKSAVIVLFKSHEVVEREFQAGPGGAVAAVGYPARLTSMIGQIGVHTHFAVDVLLVRAVGQFFGCVITFYNMVLWFIGAVI